jgi:hypothetical protein
VTGFLEPFAVQGRKGLLMGVMIHVGPPIAATLLPFSARCHALTLRSKGQRRLTSNSLRASVFTTSAPIAITPICGGHIVMRAQAQVHTARRTDTPTQVRV